MLGKNKQEGNFYVLEGLDGTGKTTIASKLAEDELSIYIKGPPEEIQKLRQEITQLSPEIQYGYYLAGNCVMDMNINQLVNKGYKVYCDRYVYSTIVFYSVLLDRELSIPQCLIKPKAIIYLITDEMVLEKRLFTRKNGTTFHPKTPTQFQMEKLHYERLWQKICLNSSIKLLVVDTSNTTVEEAASAIRKQLI